MNNTYIIHSIDKQQKFLLDVFCANCQKENELDFFPFKDSFHFEEKTNYLSIVNDNSINQYQFSCKQMNIDIKQNLFFYYNYYYLKMLYYLCKLNNLSYFFTDINDIKFAHININNSFLLCNNVIRPNNYLNDANNKFKLLSTDILEHGMFFPFFAFFLSKTTKKQGSPELSGRLEDIGAKMKSLPEGRLFIMHVCFSAFPKRM